LHAPQRHSQPNSREVRRHARAKRKGFAVMMWDPYLPCKTSLGATAIIPITSAADARRRAEVALTKLNTR
jgi:hypothetical protein